MTLVEQLEIVGIDRRRFIVAVANQFAVTDVTSPSLHAALKNHVVDSCERLQKGVGIRDRGPFAIEAVRCPRAIIPRRADGFDQCQVCLLYTSDAADEEDSVDLGG